MAKNGDGDSPKSNLTIGDHLSATVTRRGRLVGFAESAGRERSAHGDDADGKMHFGVSGKPSHGEAGTLQTGQLLVDALNAQGSNFGAASLVDGVQDVDVEAFEADDTEHARPLRIQVVRAIVDGSLWEALAHHAEVTREEVTPESVAGLLRNAITSKEKKIPTERRSDLVLALNAIDTPAACFDSVLEAFRAEHSEWAAGLGFKSIWIVGPWSTMSRQLA